MKNQKKIGIFCFYNSKGIVCKYVYRLLENISKVFDSFIIVSNSGLTEESYRGLKKYCDRIVFRENIGYDAGAYKEILTKIDFSKTEYDELTLFNDTCYWINDNFEDIYNEMREKKYDFWGITQNDDPRIRRHLQSYFLVFSKKVLNSEIFVDFWKKLSTEQTNLCAIISDFEIGLTQYLEEKEFTWGSFCGKNDKNIYSDAFQLISENNCPVIKRKAFFSSSVSKMEVKRIINYIQEHTDYPLEYIKEDLKVNWGVNDVAILGKKEPQKEICRVSLDSILSQICSYPKIRIYGITVCGLELAKAIKDKSIEFVVSDEFYRCKEIKGIKIVPFSKVTEEENSILIVTLGYDNCQKLKKNLNWKKVIFYW